MGVVLALPFVQQLGECRRLVEMESEQGTGTAFGYDTTSALGNVFDEFLIVVGLRGA